MPRAAIYVRISKDRAGAGLGVQRQEQECRELAGRLGLTVLAVYVDNDLSAYSGKPRPEYQRLLTAVEAGSVDTVVAWHTDRLHRSPTELEVYISKCDKRGVPTHTVKAGPLDLSTPSGRMVARQLGAVARYEVEHMVERQRAAKLQAATAGRWGGGRRPYGYEADGVTVRHAEAAELVAVTDELILGASLRGQAAALNARGVKTATDSAWSPTELKRVVIRPRNAGLRSHRGKVIGRAEWPAIVTEDKWRAVCGILTDSGRRTTWARNRAWLLSGVALCGVCKDETTLRGDLIRGTHSSVPSYTCRKSKCVVRNAAELDRYVGDLVVERLSRPDAVELLHVDDRPDLSAMHLEHTALRSRLNSMAGLFAEGVLDGQQLREGSQRLHAQLERLESEMATATGDSVLAPLVGADDVAAAWDAITDLDRKTAIVDTLMTVTVHRTKKGRPRGWKAGASYFNPSTIEIVWKS
jgi:DNA invertase Pin-like site-specific DNA recombinase